LVSECRFLSNPSEKKEKGAVSGLPVWQVTDVTECTRDIGDTPFVTMFGRPEV
jgi:hypothetical protein